MILIWLKHRKTRMLRKQKENTHYEVSEQKKTSVKANNSPFFR